MSAGGWITLVIIILVVICVIACCAVFACMIFDLGPWDKSKRRRKAPKKEVIVVDSGMGQNMQMMQMQQMQMMQQQQMAANGQQMPMGQPVAGQPMDQPSIGQAPAPGTAAPVVADEEAGKTVE